MPIEIRELIIKATVTQEGTGGAASPVSSNTNNNVSANEEIITACVEKVLEILKEKDAR
ncbi:MAG: DUF5908 family protein [Ginsengibacter sp.]|jgi:hypothetical protein